MTELHILSEHSQYAHVWDMNWKYSSTEDISVVNDITQTVSVMTNQRYKYPCTSGITEE